MSFRVKGLTLSLAFDEPEPPPEPEKRSVTFREIKGSDELPAIAHSRKPGSAPCPVKRTKDLRDFESLDNIFLQSIWDGITMHRFSHPPERVLDLGCGFGAWILSAARIWKDTSFVGFDIARDQPQVNDILDDLYKGRVQWSHGNFLDRLPFPDEEFDFVRFSFIGLAVPEDEWQELFQEISRVMQPGAMLEIVEEDFLFPFPPFQSDAPSNGSPIEFTFSHRNSQSSNFTISSDSTMRNVESRYHFGNRSEYPPLPKPVHSIPISRGSTEPPIVIYRDHSVLQNCFDTMFHDLFINPQVLTVLPLYLNSHFETVIDYPIVNIRLPPPSRLDLSDTPSPTSNGGTSSTSSPIGGFSWFSSIAFSLSESSPTTTNHNGSGFSSNSTSPVVGQVGHPQESPSLDSGSSHTVLDDSLIFVSPHRSSEPGTPTLSYHFNKERADKFTAKYASLHLVRTKAVVTACAEPMFEVYRATRLEGRPDLPDHLIKEDFDEHLSFWQMDMEDRAGINQLLKSRLHWKDQSIKGHESARWFKWREKELQENPNVSLSFLEETSWRCIFRSIGGFICRKSMSPP